MPRVMKPISFQQLATHWQALSSSSSGGGQQMQKQQSDSVSSKLLVCRERFPGGEPLLQVLLGSKDKEEAAGPSSPAPSPSLSEGPMGLFVGPEGGFTAVELENMAELSKAFHFVTLGDR